MALSELASATAESLSTKWPFVLTTLLALVGAWLLQPLFKQDPLSKIPLAGSEIGDENKRRVAFLQNPLAIYSAGYEMAKNGLFRMTSSREAHVIVVNPRFLRELKDLPDDVLSFSAAIDDVMHPKLTHVRSDREIVPHVIKKDLTPSLNRLNPVIAEEVELAMREEFPQTTEFTPICLNKQLLRVISKVSGRVFVGPELCRTEEYIDMGINYTNDLMGAVNAICATKPSERDVKGAKLPELEALRKRERNSYNFIKPLIEARKKAIREDPDFQKPDDILQWVLDDGQAKYGEHSDQDLTEIQLGLTFAAIHTTTLSTTNAFYTIASMPELIPELREEIRTVLRESGTFTTAALQKMKKLDSFLRESMRMYPISMASFSRKVLKTVVLSNGQVLPAGCIIEVPSYNTMHDPAVIENAEKFDAFRWYRLRENEEATGVSKASAGAANQLVTVSPASLNFGYGRHACPGRFFAANEIKMIIGRALLDYDIKMTDGQTERYKNIAFAESFVPDPTKELLFRRVAV